MTVANQEQVQEQKQSQEQEPAQASNEACEGRSRAERSGGKGAKRSTTHEQLREGRLRLLPGGIYKPASDGLTAVVLLEKAHLCAYGFRGRSMKPAFRYRFGDEAQRSAYVDEWLRYANQLIAERLDRSERARASHSLSVGDVLYSSWGYDQTNIDFYEVVSVRGACVDLRELKQNRNEQAIGMQGTCTARRGEYAGEIIRGKRPTGLNTIRIASYATASIWDGRALSWSSYA